MPPHRHVGGCTGNGREKGLRHRAARDPPFRSGLENTGFCREFRPHGIWDGRNIRLPRARPARSGFRERLFPWRYPCRLPSRSGSRHVRHYRCGLRRRWQADEFPLPQWLVRQGGAGGGCRQTGKGDIFRPSARGTQGKLQAARLGSFAAAILGHARSPLFIARLAELSLFPTTSSPSCFPKTSRSIVPATPLSGTRPGKMSLVPAAENRRGERRTPWTPSLILHGILPALRTRRIRKIRRRGRPRMRGCRSTSISAELSTQFYTSFIRDFLRGRCAPPGTLG